MTTASNDRTERSAELERAISGVEGGRKWIGRVLLLLAIAAAIGGVLQWRKLHPPPKPARYLTEESSVGDVSEVIQSTGTVQPVTKIDVGAQVSGRISKRYVDFNSVVKQGDLLAEIDPTIYQSNVNADAARVESAKSGLAGDQAALAVAKTNYDRATLLTGQGLMGQADLLQAKGNWEGVVAKVKGSEAALTLAGAALKSSQTNLAYTKIYAPIDGVVIARQIDVGQTVAASFQTPVLFTIAQDLKQMLVLADIDEADLGRLSRSQSPAVDVQVEAFPGETFPGKLQEIRFNATTVQGVVTYPAVIEVSNPDLKLRPGMTATVSIRTAQAKGVTRVPNAALRFRPTPPLGPDGKPKPFKPEPPPPMGKGRVYLPPELPDGEPKPLMVDIGISDGAFTVLKSPLPAGAKIVVDETDEAAEKKKQRGLF
ncbi:MAG: efflux RND transporter periplasmic adaptor subunit [Polyangiales bacterium]